MEKAPQERQTLCTPTRLTPWAFVLCRLLNPPLEMGDSRLPSLQQLRLSRMICPHPGEPRCLKALIPDAPPLVAIQTATHHAVLRQLAPGHPLPTAPGLHRKISLKAEVVACFLMTPECEAAQLILKPAQELDGLCTFDQTGQTFPSTVLQ
jgi:hypothetical protein